MVHSISTVAVEIFASVLEQSVGLGPEIPEGKGKPKWASCRVKRTNQLRKVAGPRFKWEREKIHGRGPSETVERKLVKG